FVQLLQAAIELAVDRQRQAGSASAIGALDLRRYHEDVLIQRRPETYHCNIAMDTGKGFHVQDAARATESAAEACPVQVKYLLDTNICIYIINERSKHVLSRFSRHAIGDLGACRQPRRDARDEQ